jgi:hypothetical protein
MAAVRKAPSSDAAFAMAFGGAQAFPREVSGEEQQQHPEAPAPLMSAGAARVLAMANDPGKLAAHVEDLAMQALRAESRAAQLAEELAALKGTTKARLDTFKRTGHV